MLKIYPYKLGSKSAKTLAQALQVKRIVPDGNYRPKHNTVVLNWGNSDPHFRTERMLNKPDAVRVAANKLLTLQALKAANVPVPDFTTDVNVARQWQQNGFRVMARHKLSAHTGEGIQVVQPEESLPYAPLYTKYTKKEREYRVHVFKGQVIDVTEKRRRLGATSIHPLIRNLKNGWVFCRDGIGNVDGVKAQSIAAVRALDLDFGAVDIIERNGQVWVLEVNTAPGLEGTTLTKYIEAIRPYVGVRNVSRRRFNSFDRRRG